MPRKTGTRTAARSASTASAAAACRQYCRVPPPIIDDHEKNWRPFWPPKAGRYRWQKLQITHGFAPIGAGVLAGFHKHRAHTEAKGNAENNGKHRDPHGVPPRLRARHPARGVWPEPRAKRIMVPGFH